MSFHYPFPLFLLRPPAGLLVNGVTQLINRPTALSAINHLKIAGIVLYIAGASPIYGGRTRKRRELGARSC